MIALSIISDGFVLPVGDRTWLLADLKEELEFCNVTLISGLASWTA
jgi:hypothetical protein